MLFYTGTLLGDIRGLRWKNIHLDEEYIDFVENWIDSDGSKGPKCKSIRKGLDIPRSLVEVIGEVGRLSNRGTASERFVFQNIDTPTNLSGKPSSPMD